MDYGRLRLPIGEVARVATTGLGRLGCNTAVTGMASLGGNRLDLLRGTRIPCQRELPRQLRSPDRITYRFAKFAGLLWADDIVTVLVDVLITWVVLVESDKVILWFIVNEKRWKMLHTLNWETGI